MGICDTAAVMDPLELRFYSSLPVRNLGLRGPSIVLLAQQRD